MEEYIDLLKKWCDGLAAHQITQIPGPEIRGALLCPACAAVHGRCHGAVYPLLYLAEKSGNPKYIRCAEGLIDWSVNMSQPDGGYVNDGMCEWKGTTVFAAVCFAKAYPYGTLLSEEHFRKLDTILQGFLSYIYHVFDIESGNINYVAGAACALELGGKLYGREDYRIRAREYAHSMLNFMTANHLIFGEGGKTRNELSRKGCHPVDIAYNLEETIPLLAEYAASSNDGLMTKALVETARAHLNFILPDGGIDESFCTRMDKWTYWGSRTSDGCALGLFLLSPYEEEFAAAAEQNLKLLAACTHKGLLFGGPETYERGEPPCIHHTFTHAAGLAGVLEWMEKTHYVCGRLPWHGLPESRYYPETDTYLAVFGDWRATITGYDCGEKQYCAPSGGAVSLLYHRLSGPIFVSSMTRYERYEIMNTQRHRDGADTPLTVRLQKDLGEYRNNIEVTPVIRTMGEITALADIMDKEAVIRNLGGNTYEIEGYLSDECAEIPEEKRIRFQKRVRFFTDRTEITWLHDGSGLSVYLPAVASVRDHIRIEGAVCEIEKETCIVSITASQPFDSPEALRIYNHVPGLHAAPLKISDAASGITVTIRVMEKESV